MLDYQKWWISPMGSVLFASNRNGDVCSFESRKCMKMPGFFIMFPAIHFGSPFALEECLKMRWFLWPFGDAEKWWLSQMDINWWGNGWDSLVGFWMFRVFFALNYKPIPGGFKQGFLASLFGMIVPNSLICYIWGDGLNPPARHFHTISSSPVSWQVLSLCRGRYRRGSGFQQVLMMGTERDLRWSDIFNGEFGNVT